MIKEVLNFEALTPVQSATIPNFLEHKDVAVEAPTGSGKTISFAVPILERLLRLDTPLKKHEVGALILSPTRELAHQIAQVLESFTLAINAEFEDENQKLAVWRLIGGTEEEDDRKFFKTFGAHIIVATPGRLEQTMKKMPDLRFGKLEVLVLDEADRLLDMGFHASISTILTRLPKQRRTGLFSATMTKRVSELIKAGMRNPIKIVIKVESGSATAQSATQVTPSTLSNYFVLVEADAKFSFLVHFLNTVAKGGKVIVYFATIASVKYFRNVMLHFKVVPEDVPIYGTHSDVPQKKREQIRQNFTEARSAILVSTDVTARGVDFPDVDWVIQFDPPKEPDDFVHRSGRTARNGRSGNALLFLLPSEESYVEFMESKHVPLEEWPQTADLPYVSAKPLKTDSETSSSAPSDHPAPERNLVMLKPKASSSMDVDVAAADIPQSEPHNHPFLTGMVDFAPKMRALSLKDREFMDSGLYAFISFVAAYKEHRATFSFRLTQLDFGALARLFGLLKLPRMAEFTASKVKNFEAANVDLDKVKYADKKREKARQVRIVKEAEEREQERAEREKRTNGFSADDFGKTSDDERDDANDQDENDGSSSESSSAEDFASDAALLKKLKRKQITQEEYDRLTGEDGLDEEIAASVAKKSNDRSHGHPNPKKRGPPGKMFPPKHAKQFKRR